MEMHFNIASQARHGGMQLENVDTELRCMMVKGLP